MHVLLYNELNPKTIKGFAKLRRYLEADDFKSADVKKIGENLYRARLNRSDRLLFSIYRYQTEHYALVLEYLRNHAYEKSRFLKGGAKVEEDLIPSLDKLEDLESEEQKQQLVYVNSQHNRFNLLDKIISFDESQQTIFKLPVPLIIIGSAGSGKTALTLEKMKEAIGNVLYVTQSPYLVKNSRDLYYAHHYENEDQEVDFLSFDEFLESIHVPNGKPISFRMFNAWFSRFRQSTMLRDAHKLFEEFRGVLTGPSTEKAYLSRNDYLNLGVKQSIFLAEERKAVYDIFEKYLVFLNENNYYDSNLISYDYLKSVEQSYDFVVVDEVQDLTNIQLYLILKTLRHTSDFLLCGDSNQIVHPNFFSWSKVKTLFYQHDNIIRGDHLIHILHTNYRNSPQVTTIANRLLKLKNQRFGSIDKESNYLVESNGHTQGSVLFLQDKDNIKKELDKKTRLSTRFAVIVMHPEQKALAKQHFSTPLVFAIQEAKGLEYENIILYNFLSAEEKRFRDISQGIEHSDLEKDLKYSRAKDKTDKSLEVYKFYVNALYVALTRAVKNLYWIEAKPKQRLLDLLGMINARDVLDLDDQGSSVEEWQQEAHKLELQGKQEQAERIRSEILKQAVPSWKVYDEHALDELSDQALTQNNKKAKLMLFEYALVYHDERILNTLRENNFKPAHNPDKGYALLRQKYYMPYQSKNQIAIRRELDKYGVEFRNPFNQTPLMVAAWLGNKDIVDLLFSRGVDTEAVDNNGFTAFQRALETASYTQDYAQKKLSDIYEKLEPDSVSIQVDLRLLKLDKHLMEFFMLNLMIAIFYRSQHSNVQGFTTQHIMDAVEHYPESVLPLKRRKRPYISSILSKNEMNRQGPYNRKLFLRIKRGYYVFNPTLALRIEGEWKNIYLLLRLTNLLPRLILSNAVERLATQQKIKEVENVLKNMDFNDFLK